jgi:RNase P subunit RPR2
MATMVSKRRSSFGMYCAQCDNELIAPEWSEYRSTQQNRHLWRCWKCDYCFETIVSTELMEDKKKRKHVFPSLLVASALHCH